ncbi:glycoside hydrolase family 6 protein [Streptomyces sp. PSAA01]|uniref:glycoside hydrolase family 6 protein n=1 Tax=Streptomyces sp. PSAA01 TaxID=2912762 RepID=UPI001F34B0AD|nr:glycoside hydrolase family 6 protein [Streptomyces sp. PSAA01]MCG0288474.1 glycoside hydrolase family 6 protein [Streptomyces sp. PSAA01]
MITKLCGRVRRPRPPAGGRKPRWAGRGIAQLIVMVLVVEVVMAATTVQALFMGPVRQPNGKPSLPVAKPFFPATTRFYTDPHNPAATWVRDHPHDRRAAAIGKRIAAEPQAAWLTETNESLVEERTRALVRTAAAQRRLPVLVPYTIPQRDCQQLSSGGAGDTAAYGRWSEALARGIGDGRAIVILEPDALAHMSCLKRRQQAERFAALSYAARAFQRGAPRARVYYDAGNSGWQPARTMADRLRRAGIERYGDGIAVNVSNFNATADEVRYGLSVIRELRRPRLGVVVDTSRNGAGPTRKHSFCDPPGRKLGRPPTAATGIPGIDAFLWVKQPGQADGCAAGAGMFLPGYAYRLTR